MYARMYAGVYECTGTLYIRACVMCVRARARVYMYTYEYCTCATAVAAARTPCTSEYMYVYVRVCLCVCMFRSALCASSLSPPLSLYGASATNTKAQLRTYLCMYLWVYTHIHRSARARAYARKSVCAMTRNTLRTRTSKQTQSNQFARLIDFPSHGRCTAHCMHA